MNEQQLAEQKPRDIDEALVCMRETLEYFHGQQDKRAIFLRLYYIMTREVHAAIYGRGDYAGKQIFIDPEWVRTLSGRFSTKYFESLAPGNSSRAWKSAHDVAEERGSAVVENALFGINAHINYDLPRAIADNLGKDELDHYRLMQIRKFDHDQVNNLLIRVLNEIQDTLAKDYEPGIAVADRLLGGLDERMSKKALKYYRERVWWNALAFAAATATGDEGIVRDKLDWESAQIAKELIRSRWLWRLESALNVLVSPFRRKHWATIMIEELRPIGDRIGLADPPHAADSVAA